MNKPVTIPKLVHEEMTAEAFREECSRMLPKSPAKFHIGQIVIAEGSFKRRLFGLVCSVESRTSDGWHYTVIRPREYDGTLERAFFEEKSLTAHE